MNLSSMNDALFQNRDASDATPDFKIDKDQEKRILEDVKTHKYSARNPDCGYQLDYTMGLLSNFNVL